MDRLGVIEDIVSKESAAWGGIWRYPGQHLESTAVQTFKADQVSHTGRAPSCYFKVIVLHSSLE